MRRATHLRITCNDHFRVVTYRVDILGTWSLLVPLELYLCPHHEEVIRGRATCYGVPYYERIHPRNAP